MERYAAERKDLAGTDLLPFCRAMTNRESMTGRGLAARNRITSSCIWSISAAASYK